MKAVFLDRDGTFIVDPPDETVNTPEKLKLFPDTIEALKLLASLDYGVVIVTNQNAMATGGMDDATFWRIHNLALEMIKPSGVHILKTYLCPHEQKDNCECRKPKPGMLLQAAKEFDIDLNASWIVGDRPTDVQAGITAGTRTILVETGLFPVVAPEATYTAPHLLDAIHYIADQQH